MPVNLINPQATAQITTNQLVASFDFLEPQQINELFRQHGDQFSTSLLLRSLKREEQVSASTWWAWEDQLIIENITGTIVPGGLGFGTLTLSAADVTANGYSYPVNFDLIQVVATGQNLRLTAKTVGAAPPYTTTFTVASLDGVAVVAAVASICFIYSTAQATGTGQKDPRSIGVVKRTFYTQIFKEAIGADGGVLADATRITQIENGGQIVGYHSMDTWAMEMRLMSSEEGAFWIGTESQLTEQSAMTTAVQLNPILATRGLFPTASLFGTTYNHGGGAWPAVAFNVIKRALTRQRVTTPYIMGIQGLTVDSAIQTYLLNANYNTAVDFTKITRNLFGGDEALAMSVNFNSFTTGPYTFCWKMNSNFSNPSTFGSSTGGVFDYEQMGVWMPLSRETDPTTGQTYGNIHYRYKGLGAYNRRMKIYSISGAGEQPMFLTEIDGTKTFAIKESGIGCTKSNQFIFLNV